MYIGDDDDDLEYRKQLGLVGIQLVSLSEALEDEQRGSVNRRLSSSRRNRSNEYEYEPGRTLVSSYYDDEEEDGSSRYTENSEYRIESMVEKLRATTFKVRMVNMMNDLIDPLSTRLKTVFVEIEDKAILRHHEVSMYLDKILKAVDAMNGINNANRGYYLAAKEFFRHPMLSIGRGMLTVMTSAFKFTFGALFGRKQQKSDTDRIVEAIEKQTEWHMTNQISQSKGFFDRLKSQGILGMGARGIGNIALRSIGADKSRAQEIEDARGRGEDPTRQSNSFLGRMVNSVQDSISSSIYGDVIDQKGRLGKKEEPAPLKINFPEILMVHDEKLFSLFESLVKRIYGETDGENKDVLEGEYKVVVESDKSGDSCKLCVGIVADHIDSLKNDLVKNNKAIENKSTDILSDLLKAQLNETVKSRDIEAVRAYEKDSTDDYRYVQHENRLHAEDLRNKKKDEHDHDVYELLAESKDGVFEVVKHTKKTATEATRGRFQSFISSIASMGSRIVSTFATVGTSILTAIAGGAASVVAAIMAAKAMRNGGGMPVPTDRRAPGPRGRTVPTGVKIGAAGVATGLALDVAGNFVEEGSTAESVIDTLSYASTGAGIGGLIGSFIPVPGVGTGLGAAVGGLIGGGYGLYKNAGTLFSSDKDEEKLPTANIPKPLPLQVSEELGSIGKVPQQEETSSLVNKTPESLSSLKEVSSSLVSKTSEEVAKIVESVKASDAMNIASDLYQKASTSQLAGDTKEKASAVFDTISGEVKPYVADALGKGKEYTSHAMEFGKELVSKSKEGFETIKTEVSALQDKMSLHLESLVEVFESVKQQGKESLSVMKENNQLTRQMVDALKQISTNTKSGPPPDVQPFADTTDGGFLKHIIGR